MSNVAVSCALAPRSRLKQWLLSVGPFWAASIAGHLIVLIVVALVWGTVHVARTIMVAPTFDSALVDPEAQAIDDLENWPLLRATIEQPRELKVDLVQLSPIASITADPNVDAPPPLGPDALASVTPGGFNVPASNSLPTAMRGPAAASSTMASTGNGPAGPVVDSLLCRMNATTRIELNATGGGTKHTDAAVQAALFWLARHQSADGSWSMDYTVRCKDDSCTHVGSIRSSAAATSFALLPFLASGITPDSKSVVTVGRKRVDYSHIVAQGLASLVQRQHEDGNLADGPHVMYTHGLATITLCEAYAMTRDPRLAGAARAAVRFIEQAQNKEDGGWRYTPGAVPGDTSVVGWQVMALKSAQLAGMEVSAETMTGVKRYLKRASIAGRYGGLFSYLPDDKTGRIAMTAVGMLCNQYVGLGRDDPAMIESASALLKSLPSRSQPNLYYWYYATQAMHNMSGPEWDAWNRAMRRVLVETQTKAGCATGSWDPELLSGQGHIADAGGRLMATSLAALSLEVYYRHLPLYKIDEAARPDAAKR